MSGIRQLHRSIRKRTNGTVITVWSLDRFLGLYRIHRLARLLRLIRLIHGTAILDDFVQTTQHNGCLRTVHVTVAIERTLIISARKQSETIRNGNPVSEVFIDGFKIRNLVFCSLDLVLTGIQSLITNHSGQDKRHLRTSQRLVHGRIQVNTNSLIGQQRLFIGYDLIGFIPVAGFFILVDVLFIESTNNHGSKLSAGDLAVGIKLAVANASNPFVFGGFLNIGESPMVYRYVRERGACRQGWKGHTHAQDSGGQQSAYSFFHSNIFLPLL